MMFNPRPGPRSLRKLMQRDASGVHSNDSDRAGGSSVYVKACSCIFSSRPTRILNPAIFRPGIPRDNPNTLGKIVLCTCARARSKRNSPAAGLDTYSRYTGILLSRDDGDTIHTYFACQDGPLALSPFPPMLSFTVFEWQHNPLDVLLQGLLVEDVRG